MGRIAPNPADPPFEVDGCHVRVLGPEDAPALQALYERCTDYHQLMEGTPTRPGAGEEELAGHPEGKNLADKLPFGIHGADGALVAYLDLIRDYPAPGEWWVGLLMLDPAARGRGLGRRIYTAAARWSAAGGAAAIQLMVLEQNAPAERFWRGLGFTELRRVPFTSPTGHRSRAIVMRKAPPA